MGASSIDKWQGRSCGLRPIRLDSFKIQSMIELGASVAVFCIAQKAEGGVECDCFGSASLSGYFRQSCSLRGTLGGFICQNGVQIGSSIKRVAFAESAHMGFGPDYLRPPWTYHRAFSCFFRHESSVSQMNFFDHVQFRYCGLGKRRHCRPDPAACGHGHV
jgi:hypothetical protein